MKAHYDHIYEVAFDMIRETSGKVSYEEVTEQVRKFFPNSKWQKSHWAWYKSRIKKGKFSDLFSDEIKQNLLKNYIADEPAERPEEQMYTWLPFFEEMLSLACKEYNAQSLCNIAKEIFQDAGFEDTYAGGKPGPLQEMDPLTFIAYFNRNNTTENRINFCKQAKSRLNMNSDVPEDFEGIATFFPMKTWFFPRAHERTNEMEVLGEFANQLNANRVRNESFTAVQKIKNVGLTKLSQIMAICKPQQYIPLNDKVTLYANHIGEISVSNIRDYVRRSSESLDAYGHFIGMIRQAFPGKTLPEISHEGHVYMEEIESIKLEKDRRYWIIAPEKNAILWEQWEKGNHITIGWGKLGNLRDYKSQKDVQRAIKKVFQKEREPIMQGKSCYDFARVMSAGDYVLAKKGNSKLLGLGVITGDYEYWPDEDDHRNGRAVKWLKTGEWDVPTNQWDKTLTEITKSKLLKAYLKIMETPAVIPPVIKPDPELIQTKEYTLQQAMKDLFIGEDRFLKVIDLLKHKKNIILQGAPGVGKTFIAQRLAYYLIGTEDKSRLEMIQFHQSYSYEDFIQGYRPDDNGGFHVKEGVFYKFCRKAQKDPHSRYVFIIDEINRGNLSKIFGELMMLIESDKRDPGYAMPLTYANVNDPDFFIPPNVYFIGTMNTADRSLAMVDYALRRRFAFIELLPHFTNHFSDFLSRKGISEETIRQIHTKMSKLNDIIRNDRKNLGPGFCIGHSFFCPNGSVGDEKQWLDRIFEYEIKPLIDEYWFDNDDKAQQIRQLLEG